MAGANITSAATGAAAVAADAGGAGRPQFLVQRPAPGSIAVTEAPAGANLKFNFSSTEAKILVQDVDIVIAFPDAARIVLPGFAFNLLSAGGEVAFTDKTESAQEVFANVSDLRLIDNPDLRTMSSADDKDGGAKEEAPPAPPPAPAPSPASSPAKPTGVADFDKPPQEASENNSRVPPTHFTPPSFSGAPSTPARTSSVMNALASNDAGKTDNPPGEVQLDITLLGVAKGQAIALPSGGQDIRGAAAVMAAATDSAFAVQQETKQLVGTAQDDVIHALDPARMPSGTFERLIDVKMHFTDPGFVAETGTITDLPRGFAVNNAEQVGDTWVLRLSKADPDHLQIELRYALPADGATPDAAASSFDLNIAFSGKNSQGESLVYSGSQTFVVQEIIEEADVVTTGANGAKIYALNATPPGTAIFAGDGNDTVHAGPGHDTLDGGAGDNLVSYAQSAAGVTVDLSTGQGGSGYAEGDRLQNFTSVEGSAHADRLTGTAGNNTFYSRGGADTIIGNGGDDTVDYSASTTGVSVDLATGRGFAGFATDNVLADIEDVVGSSAAARVTTSSR